jgi:hypothetical protein
MTIGKFDVKRIHVFIVIVSYLYFFLRNLDVLSESFRLTEFLDNGSGMLKIFMVIFSIVVSLLVLVFIKIKLRLGFGDHLKYLIFWFLNLEVFFLGLVLIGEFLLS